MDRFIVVKALLFPFLLYISSIQCEDISENALFPSYRPNSKHAVQQTQTLSYPASICTCTTNTNCGDAAANVPGICGYFNNHATVGRCCSQTVFPQDIPVIDPSTACNATCLSTLYSYWCYLPCTGQTAIGNTNPVLCSSALQTLFDRCNSCPTFGSYSNFSAFATAIGQSTTTSNNCVDFLSIEAPVETVAPLVRVTDATTSGDVNFVTASSTTVTATIPVETGVANGDRQPPVFMEVAFLSPTGSMAAQQTFDSTDFTLVTGQATYWTATASLDVGYKAEQGIWTVVVIKVMNTFGVVTNKNVTTFQLRTQFNTNRDNYGTVLACGDRTPVTNDLLGTSILKLGETERVDNFQCCSSRECGITCTSSSTQLQNTVTTLTSNQVQSTPLAIRDCSMVADNWEIFTSTDFFASRVIFRGTRQLLVSGASSEVRGDSNSQLTFESGTRASFAITNNAALEAIMIFLSGARLVHASSGTITLGSDSHVIVEGTLTMGQPNARFVINSATTLRGALHIKGDGVLGGEGTADCFAGGGNDAEIIVQRGRFQASNGASVNCVLRVVIPVTTHNQQLPRIAAQNPKFATQVSAPEDFTGIVACGADITREVIIPARGAVFVVPDTTSSDEACALPGTASIASRFTTLQIAAGGRIVMSGARTNGRHIETQTINFQNGTVFEVALSATSSNVQEHSMTLLTYVNNANAVGGAGCDNNIQVLVTNPDPTRRPSQFCDVNTAIVPNVYSLKLTIPQVVLSTASSTNTRPSFISSDSYTITMQKTLVECPSTCFMQALAEILLIDSKIVNLISYTEVKAGEIVATLRCHSTQSTEHGDAVCKDIVDDAGRSGSSLNSRLMVKSTDIDTASVDDDDSNNALYGLFGLAAIPLCLCLLVGLFLKSKKRKADNQYRQDTATFSSVAASPQPINYPIPKTTPPPPIQGPVYDFVQSPPAHMYDMPMPTPSPVNGMAYDMSYGGMMQPPPDYIL